MLHPAYIDKLNRERERREREDAEDRRIPLYVPLPPPPERPAKETEFVIEF